LDEKTNFIILLLIANRCISYEIAFFNNNVILICGTITDSATMYCTNKQ